MQQDQAARKGVDVAHGLPGRDGCLTKLWAVCNISPTISNNWNDFMATNRSYLTSFFFGLLLKWLDGFMALCEHNME